MKKSFGAAGEAFVLIVVLAWVSPTALLALTAFKPPSEISTQAVSMLPKTPTFDNFVYLWRHTSLLRTHLPNSLLFGTLSASLGTVLAVITAYPMSRIRWRPYTLFGGSLLVAQLVPPVLLIVPVFLLMRTMHLLNSRVALSLLYVALLLPFSVWMMKGYFETIPGELEEAAKVDGCSDLQAVRLITAPLAAPGVVATFMYAFVIAWHEYIFQLVLMQSSSNWGLAVGLSLFQGQHATLWGPMMAGALVYSFPAIVGFLFLQRYFVSGLTAGAVKN